MSFSAVGGITIDGWPVDLALTEEHSHDSEATQYPVEKGANITDHVRPKPISITFEGIVSASPLTRSSHHAGRDFAQLREARELALGRRSA